MTLIQLQTMLKQKEEMLKRAEIVYHQVAGQVELLREQIASFGKEEIKAETK